MGSRWVAVFTLLVGCTLDLPSTVPLGRGPMASNEPAVRRRQNLRRREPIVDGRPTRAGDTEDGPSGADSESPEDADDQSDAGDAGAADAGAADAGADAGGTDAHSEGASTVLAGRYVGSDVTIFRVPGLPDRTDKDDRAKTDVEQKSQRRLVITLIDSSNGKPICSLDGELRSEDSAKLASGQSCFGGGGMSASLSSGSVSFAGTRLELEMRLDIEVELGEERASGEIEYHFEGNRK